MIKKLIALLLTLCMLVPVAACSQGTRTLENGSIVAEANGGIVMTSGDYRMDFFKKDDRYGLRVVDLNVVAGGGEITESVKTAPATAAAYIVNEEAPVHIGLKPVAATGDIMNIGTKEYFVDQGYDEVTVQPYGVKAESTVTGKGGAHFLVTDRYMPKDNGMFTLDRIVEVLNTNLRDAAEKDEGFSSKVSFNLGDGTQFNDFEYMIPAIMYKDNRRLPVNAIGAGSTFNYMYIKETRLGLPMVMTRDPDTGYTVTISHANSQIGSGIDESTAFPWEVSGDIHYGSIGINTKKDGKDAVQLDFVWPCSEGDVGYSGNNGWTRRHHAITRGYRQYYQMGLSFAKTDDYITAATDAYKAHFALNEIDLYNVDMEDVYDAQVDMWNQTMTDLSAEAAGVPWSFLVPSGQIDGWQLECGFVGQQTQIAYQVLKDALEREDAEHIRLAAKAVSLWTDYGQIKDGPGAGLLKTRYNAGSFRYDTDKYPIFLRTMTDGYEGILDAARLAEAYAEQYGETQVFDGQTLGQLADKWFAACDLYADFLVTHQNTDGSYYRAYDPLTGDYQKDEGISSEVRPGELSGDSKENTIQPVRFLARMYERELELENTDTAESYKNALLRACEYVYDNILQEYGTFIGATIDHANVVDKEAGVFAMYGFNAAYQLTGEEKWREAAEYAAVFAISWTYTYDFRVQGSDSANIFRYGGTSGMSIICMGQSSSDNYNAFIYYELYKMYALTGDTFYKDAAEFIGCNTKQVLDLNGTKGYKYKTLTLEASNLADFNFTSINSMLAWVGVANSEPINNFYQTFGVWNMSDLEGKPVEEIRQSVLDYGFGGKEFIIREGNANE